jgi:hypothetical protein
MMTGSASAVADTARKRGIGRMKGAILERRFVLVLVVVLVLEFLGVKCRSAGELEYCAITGTASPRLQGVNRT